MYIADVAPEIRQRASEVLAGTIRNIGKMSTRYALLEAHPEQRIRVDSAALQQILRFLSFKCHPDCSVARDQAIRGSDIDRAVVITEEMPGIEERDAFVGELRKQGFTAYTQEEAYAIEAVEGYSARWKAQGAVINFRTVTEVEGSLRAHPLYEQNLSVIGGSEIGAA
jgi:hypothetical protein